MQYIENFLIRNNKEARKMGGFITWTTKEEMKLGGGGGLTIDLKGHHICQGVTDFVRRWGRDVIGQQIEVFIAFQGSTQSHLHVND